jgi:hypothetical protein
VFPEVESKWVVPLSVVGVVLLLVGIALPWWTWAAGALHGLVGWRFGIVVVIPLVSILLAVSALLKRRTRRTRLFYGVVVPVLTFAAVPLSFVARGYAWLASCTIDCGAMELPWTPGVGLACVVLGGIFVSASQFHR